MSAANDTPDRLYSQAVEVVRATQRASISLVQRHLRIGYVQAAALINRIEVEGVIEVVGEVRRIRDTTHAALHAIQAQPAEPDSRAVMLQALKALTEALVIADPYLAGVDIKCADDIDGPVCMTDPIGCCGNPTDARGRVKRAIAALENELGLDAPIANTGCKCGNDLPGNCQGDPAHCPHRSYGQEAAEDAE